MLWKEDLRFTSICPRVSSFCHVLHTMCHDFVGHSCGIRQPGLLVYTVHPTVGSKERGALSVLLRSHIELNAPCQCIPASSCLFLSNQLR